MRTLNTVLFTLTLFLCGTYAGMSLFAQIGVLPTMQRLERHAYVSTWAILDGLMDRLMPPFKATLLLLNLTSAICLVLWHRATLAAVTVASFLLSLAALVLTLRKQIPINKAIRSFPATEDDRRLTELRRLTERNFTIRTAIALVAFAILCCGAVAFSPR